MHAHNRSLRCQEGNSRAIWHVRGFHAACVRRGACSPPAPTTHGAEAAARATTQAASRGDLCVAASSGKQSVYAQQPRSLNAPSEGFDSIGDALRDLAAGKFVVVLDDEDRENEGDLIINADKVTTADMAFMVEHTSGVICIAMGGDDLDRLQLPLMVDSRANNESMYTAFTVTVDLAHGTTTGISAADRAATLRAMADPSSRPSDFRRPGHIFPLRARPGGVLVRPGHTEAALDLARLSGSYPAGVLCEIVDRRDGSMARTPQLLAFAREHGLLCITIADLIRWRLRHEVLVASPSSPPAPLQTRHGAFAAHTFASAIDGTEHVALVHGDVAGQSCVASAVVVQRPVVDVFGSTHCGQEAPLDAAMRAVAAEGAGVVLYVASSAARQPQGLASSLAEHARRQAEECSVSGGSVSGGGGVSGAAAAWDVRDDAAAAHMLAALGVQSVRLLGSKDADLAKRLGFMGVEVADVPPRQQQQAPSPPLPPIPPKSLANGSAAGALEASLR